MNDDCCKPADLALELGVSALQVRDYLRGRWPRTDSEKGSPWILTADQVRDVRKHFSSERTNYLYADNSPSQFHRSMSDEAYVISLCEEVLCEAARYQHRFPWLRGDAGTALPVDAYFPQNGLVVEYRERQHLAERPASFKLWDDKPTISGVNRRQQRARYDRLRGDVLPQQGLRLVLISPDELSSDKRGRLLREKDSDKPRVERLLFGSGPIVTNVSPIDSL